MFNRYVGRSEDQKVSEDTKLVAYGFRMFPNGVTKEYRGYCSQDSSGYKEAMNKAEKWFITLDEETCDEEVLLSMHHWSLLNTYAHDYTYLPYGDYRTTTDWYWDDVESVAHQDYFMLKSTCSMMPGCQQYGSHWHNHRDYIHHDWGFYSYPETRDIIDSEPCDGRVKTTTVSITLSGISVTPGYELDGQSDYIQDVTKWEERIKYYSLTGGGSTLTVKPSSVMMCSQNEARSGGWIGLAYFESKPQWIHLGLTNFFETYTPGYQGHSNVVAWRLSTVNLTSATTLATDRTISGTTCPGSTFTVIIDLYVTDSPVNGLSITEDISALPSSWTVSPNDGGVYNSATKKLEYVWFDASGDLGDQTVTYSVAIPGDATIGASYDITGKARITPPMTAADIGTDTVTVNGT